MHLLDAPAEWRAGVAGHLILSDEDLTSVVQGSWKRLNTLQHYKVSARHRHTNSSMHVLNDKAVYHSVKIVTQTVCCRSLMGQQSLWSPGTPNITSTTAMITCLERVSPMESVLYTLMLFWQTHI